MSQVNVTVQRYSASTRDTLGVLLIDGRFVGYTLEDERRAVKVKGETRIPAGRYQVKLRTEGGFHDKYLQRYGQPFHKGMLHVTNVPNFEYILIHIGNDESDTAGCLLVGATANDNQAGIGFIGDSSGAYARIYAELRDALLVGKEVWITYKDESEI